MILIKLGGSLLDDPVRRKAALETIVARWNAGEDVVLVHGGGKHIDAQLGKLGIAKKTHAGLRVTDDATLEVVVSVLAGSVNKMIVSELAAMHMRAAGISGSDASTLARRSTMRRIVASRSSSSPSTCANMRRRPDGRRLSK